MNAPGKNGSPLALGVIGGLVLAIACCGAPLLVIAVGSLGLSAWFTQYGYILIPVLIALIGLVGIGLYQRNRPSSANANCCEVDKNSRKLKP